MRSKALLVVALAASCATGAGCSSIQTFDHPLEGGSDGAAEGASGLGDGAGDEASSQDGPLADTTLPTDSSSADGADATMTDAFGSDGAADVASPDAADASPPADALADAPLDAGLDATSDASDAAISDAAPDAPVDAPPDGLAEAGEAGPPSLCGDGGFLFCDGFENGFSAWSQSYLSLGSITTDSTHVYRGSFAMHAHTNDVPDAGGAYAALVQVIDTWPSHVFTRFFAYQPSPQAPSPANLIDVDENYEPYAGIGILTNPPSGGLSMNTFNTGQDQTWSSEAGATTLDTWVCFELEVDTIAETSHLYMNDVEVTDLAQTNLDLGQLGILGVGLSFYLPNPQGTEDAWIDEVAVSSSRIGCSN